MSSARSNKRCTFVVVLALLASPSAVARAQPSKRPAAAPSAEPKDAKKEEAKQRFDRAMALFDRKAWDAALAEFLESRAAYPTRSNTQNAAICLRNLNRFDEALDMFEKLVAEFPNIGDKDRAAVDKEIAELRALVGTIELRTDEAGAAVTIDGRDRGTTPSPPIRVAAGSHAVRVYKAGLAPFEKRVEVAGRQNVVVDVKLEALAQSGRLSVTEDSGKAAEVLVDNVVVGKTPWQGPVAVGDHVVFLRDGRLGTQPASATVRINQVTPIVLALEPLDCTLRVEPTPNGATVAVDGVVVGSGVWDGRLRKGRHKIEVAQNGFLAQARSVDLAPSSGQRLAFALERDPDSPLWRAEKRPHVFAEVVPSFPLALVLGGEVTDAGSASFPLGAAGRVHAGYELPSGLGFGVDAGYMYITRNVDGRDTRLVPVGKPEAQGVASDKLSLKGLLVGAAAHLHRGATFPLLLRLGVGALLGDANDRRSGDFAGTAVDATRTQADAAYLYVSPEARVGYRVADRLEITAGAAVTLMVALSQPRWNRDNGVVLGNQGLAGYDEQTMFGSTLLLVEPGLGARYDF